MSTDKAKASKGKVDMPMATVQSVMTDFSVQLNSMFNDFYEKTKEQTVFPRIIVEITM